MRAISALLAFAIVLSSPAAAGAPDLPTRADVERMMIAWMRCEAEGCPQPPRSAVVRNLRCRPDTGWSFDGRSRVICVFSGRWIGDGLEDQIMECAYLWRGEDGGAWTFMASPDADLCEDYQADLADAPVID